MSTCPDSCVECCAPGCVPRPDVQAESGGPRDPRRLTSFTRFLHSITFKASAGLAQQFRRHREIALSSSNMDVAKVGGELWQELLHVSSRAIPRNQTVNGG